MKLLLNPPFYRFLGLEQDYVPLSLLAVGSQMAAEGDEVLVKNMEVGEGHYVGYSERSDNYDYYTKSLQDNDHPIWQEYRDILDELRPESIGITVLNVKYKSALKLIELSGDIPIMVGGVHPTIEPECYNVSVFRGEYESRGGRLKDLDKTPMPNYDILMDRYSPNGYGHLLSSRGCPFRCRFCASKTMWDRRVTFKSVNRILREMELIINRFGTDYFTFWDETFTLNKKRLAEFCCAYDLPAQWRCDTRADSLSDETVSMMKASGCGQMSIGIECADDEILRKVGKNETKADFQRAADILNKHQMQWKAYMIIGFPYDTEESIIDSINFVKSLRPFRITLSFFTPYKGTELYDEVRAMGLINDTYDMSLFSHQSPHNYFCPQIPRERYDQIRRDISADVDNYNKKALEIWT
jgi:radical SAM superfamily enzyme YgiQ (UPF0313 family)